MQVSGFKIVQNFYPDKPNVIEKQLVDVKTQDVLGTITAEKSPAKMYSGTKLPAFYIAQDKKFTAITRPHIYVSDLYVNLNHRNQGVGSALIQDIVKESAKCGYEGRVVLLADNKDISPIPFYRKLGFSTFNKRLNALADEANKFKTHLDSSNYAFMAIPKKAIANILKFIR